MSRPRIPVMSRCVWCTFLVLAVTAARARAAPPTANESGKQASPVQATTTQPKEASTAERVAQLNRAIDEDAKQLKKLQAELDALAEEDGELAKAEAEFQALDESLKAKKKAVAEQKDAGREAQVKALTTDIEALEKKWTLARDRFDLAVEGRKTLKARLDALGQKHEQDKTALAKLMGEPEKEAAPTSVPASQPAPAPAPTPQPTAPATPQPQPAAGTAAATQPADEDVVEQQAEVEKTTAEAKEAEQKVQTIEQQIEVLTQTIQSEAKALEQKRKTVDIAREESRLTDDEYDRQLAKPEAERPSWADLQALRKKSREANDRAHKAQVQVRQLTDRIRGLDAQRAELQQDRITALEEAKGKTEAAQAARDRLDTLKNPYSPRNILQWFIIHGPKVALILLGMALVQFLVKLTSRHFVTLLTRSSREETAEERENRAHTLVGVFGYTASVVIVVGGIVMILQEVGVPVGPVLGGAAVFGLAVAFGAQNLVRDYFHGFVMLLENQYGINDVVKIAGISGLVERITLRVTVLRDLEGVVHFIPNGQITSVSNMTHGWSRALFAVGIAYKEDVDRVMDVLTELGRELRRDPQFGPRILDDLTMLGVDAMNESSVIIKFFIKTKQIQQWGVKREMLRRIKNKFDELGIEIPFPHRTIYHRYETTPPPHTPEAGGPHQS